MKIVTVIPLKKGAFREDLTYFTAKDVPDGSIVNIPVRNKKILGLVVSSEDALNAKSGIKDLTFNLKKLDEIKGQSVFQKEFLESIMEVGKYFASRKNTAIVSLIPSAFREEYEKISKIPLPNLPLINPPEKREEKGGGQKNIKPEKLLFQASLEDRISFYKTLIRGAFAEKKSIFMVLPTEHDIETFSEIFSKGIENFTFALHGGLSAKKQVEKFKQIITSTHPILVLGTVPFLSIPRKDFGTIIIEKESSSAYKMIAKPHFDLRTFVEIYATKIKAKLIISDSLLRFETIARKETDNLNELHPLSFKTNFKGKIETIGQNEKFKVLIDNNIEEIKYNLKNKKNTFIFSLRKGLATMTVCQDCNEPVMCEKCSAPVVLYLSRDKKKRMFICNRCGAEKNSETVCASCGSWNLIPLGIGTDTVFEEIKRLFPKAKIFKLDKESAKTANGAKKIVKEFEENSGSILVGTEMALFYLKDKIPLSIVASFDSLWSIPNFKMSEKIIQLLLLILSKTKEKLIIQTKNEKDPAILAIKNENLLSFIREELQDRENLGYPPFKRFIKITHLGNKDETIKAKEVLIRMFQEYKPEIFSGFVTKLKDKYVTNALIKLEPKRWSLPELSSNSSIDENLLAKLLALPPSFSVNIDPEDLL